MSQFIANLNTIDSQPADDLFSAQDDLSLFASTDFFDFDMGDTLNVPGTDFDLSRGDQKSSTSNWQASSGTAGQDFLNCKSLASTSTIHCASASCCHSLKNLFLCSRTVFRISYAMQPSWSA